MQSSREELSAGITTKPSSGLAAVSDAGLLPFYDRLRTRILLHVERRGGRLGSGATRALLLVPDVFMLLARLTLDPEVPARQRALFGGALAYLILPADLLPELVVGPVGYLEDLTLAAGILAEALAGPMEQVARRHWSGSEQLRVVLRDVTTGAHALLGANLADRVERLLRRRGVRVGER